MLPDTKYISHEPELVVGLTGTELYIIMMLSVLVCVATSLLLWLLTPFSMPKLLSFCFLVALGVAVCLRYLIVKTKRDRPYGYYFQLLKITYYRLTGSNAYISRNGYWNNQRDNRDNP